MTSLEWRFIFESRRTLIFVMCVFLAGYIIVYRIQDKENKEFGLPMPVLAFNYRAFSIYTNGCKIKYLDPLDDTIRQYVLPPAKPLICPNKHVDILYQEDNWLRFNMTFLKIAAYCTYASINRVGDTRYKYTTEKKTFIQDTQVDDEFIKVTCFNNSHDIYQKLFAFVLVNRTKEESRKRLFQQYKKMENPLEILNVVMLGVDSMSRSNFIRQMPKSISYLKTELGAIDFHAFNKIGSNTFPNNVAILSGKSVQDLPWSEKEDLKKPFDNYTLLWKLFSASGYSTMFAEESSASIFNRRRRGFLTQPTDYYLRPFYLALDQDENHTHTHCTGNKQNTERVLDYVWDGLRTFRKFKIPHFIYTFIQSLSHGSLNDPSLGDHLYESFLKKYKSLGHCNNTILILFSDHGSRFGAIRKTTIGKFEDRLPGLYLVVPPWFHRLYPKLSRNLHINSRRLVTAFDVHETLKNVLGFNGRIKDSNTEKPGISLFSEIPDTRTCVDASIPVNFCSCFETTNLPEFDNKVISATNATLHWINTLTNEYRNVCAEFEIEEVLKAEEFKFQDMKTYQIIFEVNPSEAIFESTVMKSRGKWILIGDVSRINRYGSQSDCVNKLSLKEFCFCVL